MAVRDLTDSPGRPAVAELLERRLRAELVVRGYTLADPGEDATGRGNAAEPRVTTIELTEVEQGTDLLVAAFYRSEGESIVIQFVLIDPVVDIVVGGVLSRQRAGLTISTSVDEAIGDLRPALDRWESDRDVLRRGPPPDKVERIFVTGPQEDVRVRFAELEIGEVRGGRIFVPYSPFPVGTTVPMVLSKTGYHTRVQQVVLDEPEVETRLPRLYPASRLGLMVLWTSSYVRGGGLGIRLYAEPDVFYVLAEHYRFMNPAAGGRATWVTDNRLGLGLYVGPPAAPLRGFAELGGGVILTDLEPPATGLVDDELYRDVFAGVSVGAELNLGRWKPFLRADVDYALGFTRNNLLGNRWLSPPVTSLPVPVPMISVGVQHTW